MKILFIENIPWLQRVDDYRLLTAEEWLELKEENYKEKIFELSEFLHSLIFFLILKLSWNLPKLSLGCWRSLPSSWNSLGYWNSASWRSLGDLFIAEALGLKKALSLWCLPRVWRLQEVRFFSSFSFYHMANESSTCFLLLSHSKRRKLLFTKHYFLFFIFFILYIYICSIFFTPADFTYFSLFFYWIITREWIYKDTDVQKILDIS